MSTEPKILFRCIKEKGKLRIRIESYINSEGKKFDGVYNNNYNCQFPKDIRQENQMYEAPERAVTFVNHLTKPFYRVSAKLVTIFNEYKDIKIYGLDLEECVICLGNAPNIIFAPCGHLCSCSECFTKFKEKKCPICRGNILKTLNK